MSKPAARIGDMHSCPMVTPGTGVPHVGGVIIGPGCGTVLIEGLPAARSGDRCAHGGRVTGGCGSVLIGEGRKKKVKKQKAVQEEQEWQEPSREEKVEAINIAIMEAIRLLERKIELMENNDVGTIEIFKEWFGYYDDTVSTMILERTKRV